MRYLNIWLPLIALFTFFNSNAQEIQVKGLNQKMIKSLGIDTIWWYEEEVNPKRMMQVHSFNEEGLMVRDSTPAFMRMCDYFKYNASGKLIQKIHNELGKFKYIEKFHYNEDGNITLKEQFEDVNASDSVVHKIVYEYDASGNLVNEDLYFDGEFDRGFKYSYEIKKGKVVKITKESKNPNYKEFYYTTFSKNGKTILYERHEKWGTSVRRIKKV